VGVAEAGSIFTSPLMGEVAAKLRVGVTFGCRKDHPTPALRADPPQQGEGVETPVASKPRNIHRFPFKGMDAGLGGGC